MTREMEWIIPHQPANPERALMALQDASADTIEILARNVSREIDSDRATERRIYRAAGSHCSESVRAGDRDRCGIGAGLTLGRSTGNIEKPMAVLAVIVAVVLHAAITTALPHASLKQRLIGNSPAALIASMAFL